MKSDSSFEMGEKGYYSGLFGKWHKLEINKELDTSFDESIIYYGHHWEERDGKMRHVTELNKVDSIQFLDKWHKREQQKTSTIKLQKAGAKRRNTQVRSYQNGELRKMDKYKDGAI